ncbi:MAG: toprim domain-containing protein [Pseudomonadota bacterium]
MTAEPSRLTPTALEQLALARFGAPKRRGGGVLRYGRKGGSLVVHLSGPRAGWWYDWSLWGTPDWCGRLDREPGTDTPGSAPFDPRAGGFAADDERLAGVRELVRASRWPEGTPTDVYLASRGITERPLPPSVRHLDNPRAALFLGKKTTGAVIVVQLVYLTADGAKDRRRAVVKRTRAAGSDWAPVAGFRMPGRGEMILAEGPETGLSLWQALGRPVIVLFGMRGSFRTGRRRVTLAGDPDAYGSPAWGARCRAAIDLARRHHRVRVAVPPAEAGDWNDVLQREGDAGVRARWRRPALRTVHDGDEPMDRSAADAWHARIAAVVASHRVETSDRSTLNGP